MKVSEKSKEGLFKAMKDMKEEQYAIVNPALTALEEYPKGLYLQLLCTVVQYENDPTEGQLLYLERLAKGLQTAEPLAEYMRKALTVTEEALRAFNDFMKEGPAKYYFALESMVLAALGEAGPASYEYVAGLVELLGLSKKETEYVALVAKSVLQQDPAPYDEAKKLVDDNTQLLDFLPYIRNYYVGAVVENRQVIHYTAPSLAEAKGVSLKETYGEKRVTFTNLVLHVTEAVSFDGCEEVTFSNCHLYGGEHGMWFNRVGAVTFENCKVYDFSNRVAELYKPSSFVVRNCFFQNCHYSFYDEERHGGVFCIPENNDRYTVENLLLENNELQNCYIQVRCSDDRDFATGVFVGCKETSIGKLTVKGNKFSGCECIGGTRWPWSYCHHKRAMVSYFGVGSSTINGNIATGGETEICSEWNSY